MGSDVIQGPGVVQAYNPASNRWDSMAPMVGGGRGELASASLGDFIYTIGGYRKFNNNGSLNDALCLRSPGFKCVEIYAIRHR